MGLRSWPSVKPSHDAVKTPPKKRLSDASPTPVFEARNVPEWGLVFRLGEFMSFLKSGRMAVVVLSPGHLPCPRVVVIPSPPMLRRRPPAHPR